MEFTSCALKGGTVLFEKGLDTKFIGIFIHTLNCFYWLSVVHHCMLSNG